MRMPIVRTMRHPPDSVPSPIAAWQSEHDPERDCRLRALRSTAMPGGDQRSHDDAHRLLRVVAAVPQRVERRRAELEPPEGAVDAARANGPKRHDR